VAALTDVGDPGQYAGQYHNTKLIGSRLNLHPTSELSSSRERRSNMSNDDPLYLGFTRRRRFLVGVSLALAAASFLALRIDEVNVLGNKATVGNSGRVILLGYLVWLWALWTYIQWFNDYGAWQKTAAMYVNIRDQLLIKSLGDIEVDPERLDRVRSPAVLAAGTNLAFNGQPLVGQLTFETRAEKIFRDKESKLAAVCVVRCWQPSFPSGRQNFSSVEQFFVPIKFSMHATQAIRAIARLIITTRYFTEYLAPFLIALAPWVPLVVGLHSATKEHYSI
jgi:hypothetical protein